MATSAADRQSKAYKFGEALGAIQSVREHGFEFSFGTGAAAGLRVVCTRCGHGLMASSHSAQFWHAHNHERADRRAAEEHTK